MLPRCGSRQLGLVTVCWTACWRCGGAKVFEGELPESSDFAVFVGKYVMDFDRELAGHPVQSGGVAVQLTWLAEDHPPNHTGRGRFYVMLFDDEDSRFRAVQRVWNSTTCLEKKKYANSVTPIDQKGTMKSTIRERLRPRFWWAAIVGCGVPAAPRSYSVHFTNIHAGWLKEFSVDHRGLLLVFQLGTVVFLLSSLAVRRAALKRAAALGIHFDDHPHIQLIKLAFAASTASCFCFSVHYEIYARDGFGSQRIRFLAVLAATVATCSIFLLGMMCSVGWGVSSASLKYRRPFIGLAAFVGLLSSYCEIHAETTNDVSTSLYSYQSTPGMLTIISKIFMFCWFGSQIRATYEEELDEARRRFYRYLAVGWGAWALNVPVTVLLAFKVEQWYRYRVVTIEELAARYVGQMLLAVLFCGPLSPITAQNTIPPVQW